MLDNETTLPPIPILDRRDEFAPSPLPPGIEMGETPTHRMALDVAAQMPRGGGLVLSFASFDEAFRYRAKLYMLRERTRRKSPFHSSEWDDLSIRCRGKQIWVGRLEEAIPTERATVRVATVEEWRHIEATEPEGRYHGKRRGVEKST